MAKHAPATPEHPWERHPGETPQAFRAFGVYRELGPDRSLALAARSLQRPPGFKRALEQWSSRFNWLARVQAWDEHLDLIARQKETERVLAMRERQAQEAEAYQAALLQPTKVLLERLASGDKELLQDLKSMPARHLIDLVIRTARVMPGPVKVEWMARGVPLDPGAPDPLNPDDAVGDPGRSRFRIIIEDTEAGDPVTITEPPPEAEPEA